MKIIVQSILFIIIVSLFAITSDRLGKVEKLSSMTSGSSQGNTMGDREFLGDLIAHHEGSIAMAKAARVNSNRPEIIKFSDDVIAMETSNVEQAYIWRRDWYSDTNHIYLDQTDKKISMLRDLGVKDDKFDLRFLDAMIAHHEGAIKMLGEILVPTTKKEIHEMATGGIIGLSKDVEIMKNWRSEWYGK